MTLLMAAGPFPCGQAAVADIDHVLIGPPGLGAVIASASHGSVLLIPAGSAELEARVAALEAERADYRAVLAAVNALGENQRERTEQLRQLANGQRQLTEGQRQLADGQTDTNARVRSMQESLAEMRDPAGPSVAGGKGRVRSRPCRPRRTTAS